MIPVAVEWLDLDATKLDVSEIIAKWECADSVLEESEVVVSIEQGPEPKPVSASV